MKETMYLQKIAEQHGCHQCLWLFGEDHEITEVITVKTVDQIYDDRIIPNLGQSKCLNTPARWELWTFSSSSSSLTAPRSWWPLPLAPVLFCLASPGTCPETWTTVHLLCSFVNGSINTPLPWRLIWLKHHLIWPNIIHSSTTSSLIFMLVNLWNREVHALLEHLTSLWT